MYFGVIDIILAILAITVCIRAGIKGLIDEVFGLGTFIIGIFLAAIFMKKLQPYLATSMNDKFAAILSFLIIFIIVFLVMKILQVILKSIFSASILNSLDHGLGILIGMVEGILLIAVVFIVMENLQTWIDTENIRNSSYLYRIFDKLFASESFQLLENA